MSLLIKTYNKVLRKWATIDVESLGSVSGLSLGETDSTAYRGDRGKASYDLRHSNSLDHAPQSDNQDLSGLVVKQTGKSLIADSEIERLSSLTGGADPFTSKLILEADKPTGANVTPVTLELAFNFEVNSKYVIDIYAIVAPTAATTGCGFMLDVSQAVTYVGLFVSHQLANTGTISGSGSIGDSGATAQGVSSGMPNTGSNFVYGGGMLITGANAGTATFFFRSETTAVTTCKAGTMIRIMKML